VLCQQQDMWVNVRHVQLTPRPYAAFTTQAKEGPFG